MEQGYVELTVLFGDPFWVGIYERRGADLSGLQDHLRCRAEGL